MFVDFDRALRSDPTVTIIPSSTELFAAGVELYATRPDKEWSLTDCISFVVMEREGLTDALTGDRHFEQAGFKVLLSNKGVLSRIGSVLGFLEQKIDLPEKERDSEIDLSVPFFPPSSLFISRECTDSAGPLHE